jgi:hypothetical protein
MQIYPHRDLITHLHIYQDRQELPQLKSGLLLRRTPHADHGVIMYRNRWVRCWCEGILPSGEEKWCVKTLSPAIPLTFEEADLERGG